MDPAFRSPSSTELLLAAKPRARRCQRAPSYHIGNTEYEKHIIERGGSFDQNKDRHFTLVSPSDRNPNKKRHAYNHFQDSPRRDLRCGHGRRAEEERQVLPHAQWLSCLCRHDHQGVRQETSTIRNSSRSEEGRKICSFRIPRGLLPSRTRPSLRNIFKHTKGQSCSGRSAQHHRRKESKELQLRTWQQQDYWMTPWHGGRSQRRGISQDAGAHVGSTQIVAFAKKRTPTHVDKTTTQSKPNQWETIGEPRKKPRRSTSQTKLRKKCHFGNIFGSIESDNYACPCMRTTSRVLKRKISGTSGKFC